MGERVSVRDLRCMSRRFFERVINILEARNKTRGDTYLEMEIDEFGSFIRDKASRIKSSQKVRESASSPEDVRKAGKDQIDSILDVAGYAALLFIKMNEDEGFKEEDFGIK